MKKKFAVAAATAALIAASFTMSVFAADDITGNAPADAVEVKDDVYVVEDPSGNVFAEVNAVAKELAGAGFVKFNGKIYYVDANKRFEECTTGVWGGYGFKDGKAIEAKTVLTVGDKTYLVKEDGTLTKSSLGADTAEFVAFSTGRNNDKDYIVTDEGEVVKGWKKLGANWYYAKPDGTPVQSAWVQTTPGRWYFVDDNGLMVTYDTVNASSTVTTSNAKITLGTSGTDKATIKDDKAGKTYVVNNDGLWLNGWVYDNGSWYFYTNSATDAWVKYGTKWVYVSSTFEAKDASDGVVLISGKNYAFDEDCYMITGLGKVDAGYVYADANGVLQSGYQTIDGVKYWFDTATYLATEGVHTDSNSKDVLTDKTGKVLVNQWLKVVSDWKLGDANGIVVAEGPAKVNGSTYYFDGGVMVTGGVYTVSVTGDAWTYTPGASLLTSSSTAKAEALVNSIVIDKTGRKIDNGWAQLDDGWAYAKDGKAYDGWLLYNGSWYYIDGGKMLTSQYVGQYYLNSNGVWVSTGR